MEQNYIKNKNEINKIFINILLRKGKKTYSEKKLKNILINIKKKTKKNPKKILNKAIDNLSPKIKTIELQKRKWKKNKKMNFYFLFFLKKDKQIKISIKWLLLNYQKIENEIIATSKNRSKTIILKKNYYKNIKKIKFDLNL